MKPSKKLTVTLPANIEDDDELWRAGCQGFRNALNEMTGRDGYVVKRTYEAILKHALRHAKKEAA